MMEEEGQWSWEADAVDYVVEYVRVEGARKVLRGLEARIC